MKSPKMLIVDDEADIVELVSYNLRREGFYVTSATDGEEALSELRKGKFDLIILDLMLPGIQGMELCRIIRSDPRTERLPIIMLTAKGEEVDRILGLEMGADDSMSKPFSPRELLARVKAVLRRISEKPAEEEVVRIGDLVINKETYTVTKGGAPAQGVIEDDRLVNRLDVEIDEDSIRLIALRQPKAGDLRFTTTP